MITLKTMPLVVKSRNKDLGKHSNAIFCLEKSERFLRFLVRLHAANRGEFRLSFQWQSPHVGGTKTIVSLNHLAALDDRFCTYP